MQEVASEVDARQPLLVTLKRCVILEMMCLGVFFFFSFFLRTPFPRQNLVQLPHDICSQPRDVKENSV